MIGRGRSCKVVFLGDTSVGKSCLAVRFVRNEFFQFQEPTIGAAFLAKNITLNDTRYKFEIWDTAGQERYRSLAPMYYRGAKGAVVVYDITSEDTFKGAKSWIKELKTKTKNCVVLLVGNKVDLIENRKVDIDMVEDFVKNHHLLYLETSAKTGKNVEEIFKTISKNLPKDSEDVQFNESLDITLEGDNKERYTIYNCC